MEAKEGDAGGRQILGARDELRRTLTTMLRGRGLTALTAAQRMGTTRQYVTQLLNGTRGRIDGELLARLQPGYGYPDHVRRGMLLRFQVMSAFEEANLSDRERMFLWRGIEQRLEELGVQIPTDPAEFIAETLRSNHAA